MFLKMLKAMNIINLLEMSQLVIDRLTTDELKDLLKIKYLFSIV